jgi:hypothetical protein
MEWIESSKTSAIKAQTPGDYKKTQYGMVLFTRRSSCAKQFVFNR